MRYSEFKLVEQENEFQLKKSGNKYQIINPIDNSVFRSYSDQTDAEEALRIANKNLKTLRRDPNADVKDAGAEVAKAAAYGTAAAIVYKSYKNGKIRAVINGEEKVFGSAKEFIEENKDKTESDKWKRRGRKAGRAVTTALKQTPLGILSLAAGAVNLIGIVSAYAKEKEEIAIFFTENVSNEVPIEDIQRMIDREVLPDLVKGIANFIITIIGLILAGKVAAKAARAFSALGASGPVGWVVGLISWGIVAGATYYVTNLVQKNKGPVIEWLAGKTIEGVKTAVDGATSLGSFSIDKVTDAVVRMAADLPVEESLNKSEVDINLEDLESALTKDSKEGNIDIDTAKKLRNLTKKVA